MAKDYLKITIYKDGSHDIIELTKEAYDKLFDRYNSSVETIHGLGDGQCWMDLAHSKVILCKKESLPIMKHRFKLKDSENYDNEKLERLAEKFKCSWRIYNKGYAALIHIYNYDINKALEETRAAFPGHEDSIYIDYTVWGPTHDIAIETGTYTNDYSYTNKYNENWKKVDDSMSEDELFDKVLEMIKNGKIGDDELMLITGDEYTLGEAREDLKKNPWKIARWLIQEEVITPKHFEDSKIKDALEHPEYYGKNVRLIVGNALSREIERMFGQDVISKKVNDKNNIEYILPYDSRLDYIVRRWKRNYIVLEDSKISDIIKKTDKGYEIYSHKGKRLSKAFKTRKEAEERLKEIEMFKHMKDADLFDGYNIVYENGYYAIYKNGKFISSADSESEARADILGYIAESKKNHRWQLWYTNSVDQGAYTIVEAPTKEKAIAIAKKEVGPELRGNFRDITMLDSRKEIKDMKDRFTCQSYYSSKFTSLEDELKTDDLSKAKEWAWEKGNLGYAIRIIDNATGELWNFEDLTNEEDLEDIDPAKIDWWEEDYEGPETVHLWILSWYNKNGNKFTAEFDNKEDAEAYIASHQDEDHNEFKIREDDVSLMDCLHISTKDEKINENRLKTIMKMQAEEDYNNGEFPEDNPNKWIGRMIMYTLVNRFNRQLTDEEKAFVREYAKYIYEEYMPGYINANEESEEEYTGKYIYLFPGDLNKRDLRKLADYNLELLGVNELEDWNGMAFKDFAVKGTKEDLERYASDYLDYVLHPDYLYKEDEFGGELKPYVI